jgi:hypothetical protein
MLHDKLLALDEKLLAIVLWHENGHVLMDNGELKIEKTEYGSKLKVNGQTIELIREDAQAFVTQAYEQKDIQQRRHYLLRALAREIFGDLDIRLSAEIKRIKGKDALSDQGGGMSSPAGGVNLTADWLKVEATNKDKNTKVSLRAFSEDNFAGWQAVINRLAPVSLDTLSRLIHRQPTR